MKLLEGQVVIVLWMKVRCAQRTGITAFIAAVAFTGQAEAQWPQWGGPNRNFTVQTSGLADKWPADGPRRIWKKRLGDGCSAIVVDDGIVYTMFRKGKHFEYVVALEAETGKTVWKQKNRAFLAAHDDGAGHGGGGPNATPLIAGDYLYSAGTNALLRCLDKKTGDVKWEHDLVGEFGAGLLKDCGYSSSPIAYEGLVIVSAGRVPSQDADDRVTGNTASHTLIAFDALTGRVAWRSLNHEMGFSSPILIRLHEQDQLVVHTMQGLVGVDPRGGEVLWEHSSNGWIVTPVFVEPDSIFCVSEFQPATCSLVKLAKRDGKVVPEVVWSESGRFTGQPEAVRVGGTVYGASKQNLVAVDLGTGARRWVERGFPMANCLYADGKLVILDQDGKLSIATAGPDGISVHSQSQVTERNSFTAPTLVGKTLYVRDRKHIMALDLG